MKKQVLLWVILSVTLLVVIVLGASLWLLRGQDDKGKTPVGNIGQEQNPYISYFEIPYRNTPLPGIETQTPAPQTTATPGIDRQDFAYGEAPEAETKPPAEKTAPAPAIRQAKTAAAAGETTPAKRTSLAPRANGHYWIQTGAYKSKSKADSCNAVLMENGLAGRISTFTTDESTFFRVRIGPYANKKEADKFLLWIKKIEGFEESYVSIVQ